MQCARAIPVTWLDSGSCQARPSRLNTNERIYIYTHTHTHTHTHTQEACTTRRAQFVCLVNKYIYWIFWGILHDRLFLSVQNSAYLVTLCFLINKSITFYVRMHWNLNALVLCQRVKLNHTALRNWWLIIKKATLFVPKQPNIAIINASYMFRLQSLYQK